MSKTDFLKAAFREATVGVVVNSVDDKSTLFDMISNSMKAFAAREGWDFSEEEIKETIVAELKPLLDLSDNVYFNNIKLF